MRLLAPAALAGSLLFLTGCATAPGSTMVIQAGADMRCMQQKATDATGKEYATRWCSLRRIFQPNAHVVRVNGQTLFDGNDRDDVRAEQVLAGVPMKVACTPRIEVTSMQTDLPLPVAQLPAELVQACRVEADAKGLHKPFLRDAACGKVYAATVGPMVGKVLPFKRTQECEIQAGGTTVFKGTFVYR